MNYPRRVWDSVAKDYDVIWGIPHYTPILKLMIRETRIRLGIKAIDVVTGMGRISMEVARKVGKHGMVLVTPLPSEIAFLNRSQFF